MARYGEDFQRRFAHRYDLGLVDRDFGTRRGFRRPLARGYDLGYAAGRGPAAPYAERTPQGYVVDPELGGRPNYDFAYRAKVGARDYARDFRRRPYDRGYDQGPALRAGRLDYDREQAPLFRGWNNGYWGASQILGRDYRGGR